MDEPSAEICVPSPDIPADAPIEPIQHRGMAALSSPRRELKRAMTVTLLRTVQVTSLLTMTALALLPEPVKSRLATRGLIHDSTHIGAFLIASVLISVGVSNSRNVALCAAGLMLLGITLELGQVSRFRNRFEYGDILDDGIGIALGSLCRLAVDWFRSWSFPSCHRGS